MSDSLLEIAAPEKVIVDSPRETRGSNSVTDKCSDCADIADSCLVIPAYNSLFVKHGDTAEVLDSILDTEAAGCVSNECSHDLQAVDSATDHEGPIPSTVLSSTVLSSVAVHTVATTSATMATATNMIPLETVLSQSKKVGSRPAKSCIRSLSLGSSSRMKQRPVLPSFTVTSRSGILELEPEPSGELRLRLRSWLHGIPRYCMRSASPHCLCVCVSVILQ